MTNEQLAILLDNYRDQLVDICNGLKGELKDLDLEYHQKQGEWIGEGKKPVLGTFEGTWFDTTEEGRLKVAQLEDPDNWEWLNEYPVCLDPLSALIDSLERDIQVLAGIEEDNE